MYFNVYINDLAMEADQGPSDDDMERGAIILMADVVLMQADTGRKLQGLLDVATRRKKEKNVT